MNPVQLLFEHTSYRDSVDPGDLLEKHDILLERRTESGNLLSPGDTTRPPPLCSRQQIHTCDHWPRRVSCSYWRNDPSPGSLSRLPLSPFLPSFLSPLYPSCVLTNGVAPRHRGRLFFHTRCPPPSKSLRGIRSEVTGLMYPQLWTVFARPCLSYLYRLILSHSLRALGCRAGCRTSVCIVTKTYCSCKI